MSNELIESEIDILSNPQKLVLGVTLYKRLDRTAPSKKTSNQKKKNLKDVGEGKIIFSLEDLPIRVVFVTENEVTVERINQTDVRIGGSKIVPVTPVSESLLNKPTSTEPTWTDSIVGFFSSTPNNTAPTTTTQNNSKTQNTDENNTGFFSSFFKSEENENNQNQNDPNKKGDKKDDKSKNKDQKGKKGKEPVEEKGFFEKAIATITGEEPEPKKKEKASIGDKIGKKKKEASNKMKATVATMMFEHATSSVMKGIMK